MTINCIIVDDEELAQRVVERYINDFPLLKLVQKCNDALEAMDILHNQNIDLLFFNTGVQYCSFELSCLEYVCLSRWFPYH